MLHRRDWLLRSLGVSGMLFLGAHGLSGPGGAAEPAGGGKRKPRFGEFDPEQESVDLFDGMEDGRLQVRLICKDSTESSVLIVNTAPKPLNVLLPTAFGGTPTVPEKKAERIKPAGGKVGLLDGRRERPANVELPAGWEWAAGLAQPGGFNGALGGGNQQTQAVGGGFNNAGGAAARNGGGFNGGGGGPLFCVPPEKMVQLRTPLVCLEHGKKTPSSGVAYLLKKVEEVTTSPGVRDLCGMLSSGALTQPAAQAAAWHLANGMSWKALRDKRLEHLDGMGERYFAQADLDAGRKAAEACLKAAQTAAEKANVPVSASAGG